MFLNLYVQRGASQRLLHASLMSLLMASCATTQQVGARTPQSTPMAPAEGNPKLLLHGSIEPFTAPSDDTTDALQIYTLDDVGMLQRQGSSTCSLDKQGKFILEVTPLPGRQAQLLIRAKNGRSLSMALLNCSQLQAATAQPLVLNAQTTFAARLYLAAHANHL